MTGSCDVLVIDDDAETVDLLVSYLASKHVRTRGITSSHDYLGNIRETMPRLVLLDVAMPNANGYDLCSEIKKDPRTKQIQVVLFTAMSPASVIQGADRSGADGYLLKPFCLADLDRLVGIEANPSLAI